MSSFASLLFQTSTRPPVLRCAGFSGGIISGNSEFPQFSHLGPGKIRQNHLALQARLAWLWMGTRTRFSGRLCIVLPCYQAASRRRRVGNESLGSDPKDRNLRCLLLDHDQCIEKNKGNAWFCHHLARKRRGRSQCRCWCIP